MTGDLTDTLSDPMAIIFILVIALQFATIVMLSIALIRDRRKLERYEKALRAYERQSYVALLVSRDRPATDEGLDRLRKMAGLGR